MEKVDVNNDYGTYYYHESDGGERRANIMEVLKF